MKKFKCKECGYVHIGDEPPSSCPVCAFDAEVFFEMDSDSGAEDYEFYEMIDTDSDDLIKLMRGQFSSYSELSSTALAMSVQAKNEGKHYESEKLEKISSSFSRFASYYAMYLGEYLEFNTDSNIAELKKNADKINTKNNTILDIIESERLDEYKDSVIKMIESTEINF